MTRASAAALVAVALAAGLALRLARLDVRPMHHDEANQAVKFGALVERSQYRYDTHDHHGPTLYYLTLPAAWLRGQATLASLDERTLRAVPAVFGAATILLLPLLTSGIGRTAVASAAVLMALSPAMVFYSRMYIQESMFACFALAFTIAVGRAMTEPGSAVAGCGGRRRRAGDRDQRDVGHRPSRICRGSGRCVVVAGAQPAGDEAGREAVVDSRPSSARRRRPSSQRSSTRRFSPILAARSDLSGRPVPISNAAWIPPTTCSRGTTTWDCSPGRHRAA